MTTVKKSDILNQISDEYPNFLKKDLKIFLKIILDEIKNSLKRSERVELRDSIGTFSIRIQNARESRNPKSQEKVKTPERKVIHYRMSKKLKLKLNNDK